MLDQYFYYVTEGQFYFAKFYSCLKGFRKGQRWIKVLDTSLYMSVWVTGDIFLSVTHLTSKYPSRILLRVENTFFN